VKTKGAKGEEISVVPWNKFLPFVGSLLRGSVQDKVNAIWNVATTEEGQESISAQEILQVSDL